MKDNHKAAEMWLRRKKGREKIDLRSQASTWKVLENVANAMSRELGRK